MKKHLPIPTIQQQITRRMKECGLSRFELIKAIGYTNIAKGLRRLDTYLATLQAPSDDFISRVLVVLDIDSMAFYRSLEVSMAMTRRRQGDGFSPYIELQAPLTIAPLVTRFAMYQNFYVQSVPQDIQNLPFSQEMVQVFFLHRKLVHRFAGQQLSLEEKQYGFRYFRSDDCFLEFCGDGLLIHQMQGGRFRCGV